MRHRWSRIAERNAALITDPRSFSVFIVIVLATAGTLRVALFPGVGGDDGEQLVFSQFFAWGYQVRNPPLITWLLIALQKVLGPTEISVVVLRMSILAGIYFVTLRLGQRLLDDQRLAPLGAGALLMIFYVAWNTIHGFSHSTMVTFWYAVAVLMILRIADNQSLLNFVLLGFVIGLGILTKYSFVVFLVSLIGAAVLDQHVRRALLSPALILSLLIAGALLFPHAEWYLANKPAGFIAAERELAFGENLLRIAKGLLHMVVAAAGFLLPLWLLLLIVFRTSLRKPATSAARSKPYLHLLERTALFIFMFAIIGIVAVESDRIRTHYMFFLSLFPLYFFMRFGTRMRALDIRRFSALISLAGVVVVGGLVGKYMIEPLVCGHCEDHIPYDDFADQLRRAGFEQGTIYAFFHRDPLPGNLRTRFPESRTVSAKHPGAVPPRQHKPAQCLIIWPVIGAVHPKSATIRGANKVLKTNLPHNYPSKVITATLPPYGKRRHQLAFVLIPEGKGDCR